MKITRVEPILINLPFQPQSRDGGRLALPGMETLFVRVETDAGVTGWGEAFGFRLSAATRLVIETLIAPLCVGRDPIDIAALMRDVQYRLHNYGRNGPALFGLAGVNIALWDIAGKIVGSPLHRLLGAAPRTHVPAYASLWRYGDAGTVRRKVEEALARGYRALKLHEVEAAIILAAREAAGPGIPLSVDVNCSFTPREAVDFMRRLGGLNVRWIEEPTWPPEDFSALAEVSRDGALPVAAGENIATPAEFATMLRMRAVAYAQPSVAKLGISALREVAAMAASHDIALAPHSPYVGPGLIATLHIAAAGDFAVERYYCDLEPGPLGDLVNAVDGRFALPAAPGLGIEVDEALLARYRVA